MALEIKVKKINSVESPLIYTDSKDCKEEKIVSDIQLEHFAPCSP